jgi:uncharacterized membrane protein YfhO
MAVISDSGLHDSSFPAFHVYTTPDSSASINKVKIVKYNFNNVEISTETDRDGLLVISDTYYPGWKAWVDGNQTVIYRTNLLFRGIHVTAGRHTIYMKFSPTYWNLSTGSSLFALFFIISLVIQSGFGRARKKKIPEPVRFQDKMNYIGNSHKFPPQENIQ